MLTPVTVELDLLGGVLPQVEQARSQFPASTRLRVDHQLVPVLALSSHVCDISSLRCSPRTRHDRGYPQDPVSFSETSDFLYV